MFATLELVLSFGSEVERKQPVEARYPLSVIDVALLDKALERLGVDGLILPEAQELRETLGLLRAELA